MEQTSNYKVIRHKNPKGKTTWYRSLFYDKRGQVHKSPYYRCGNQLNARRAAQSWLYANIHVWCKIANVEQRIEDEEGKSKIIQLYTEEII